MKWIILVLIYGILKGIRDISKKKALETCEVVETLFVYTLISFCFVIPDVKNVGGVATRDMLLTALKSFVIFVAFLFSFYAIEKMSLGIYGIVDLSRMAFSLILGVFMLGETLGVNQYVGIAFVAIGMILLKYKPGFLSNKRANEDTSSTSANEDTSSTSANVDISSTSKNGVKSLINIDKKETTSGLIVFLAFASAFLNGISGIMDKILTRTMSSAQLQFWYMLFMLVYYGIYVLITKTKIHWKKLLTNPYVWVISVLFIIADRCLFIANADPASRVTVMTLIKQVCVVVTIIGGRIIYKEKDTLYKLFCALVVVIGIAFSAL
ncbi:MAG: DMT family transporter [Lachnospiraceae bacterium]|nr:DMT family transporter [Lachnospiraceae bacterium]